jgi:hypothetical protein
MKNGPRRSRFLAGMNPKAPGGGNKKLFLLQGGIMKTGKNPRWYAPES